MQPKLVRYLLAISCIMLLLSFFVIYRIQLASESEKNLHALIATTNALEDFLVKQKRWPTSWEELIKFSAPLPGSMYVLPDDEALIRGRVKVRFDVSSSQLQDPRNQMLVSPIGPCFNYERRLELLYKKIEKMKPVH